MTRFDGRFLQRWDRHHPEPVAPDSLEVATCSGYNGFAVAEEGVKADIARLIEEALKLPAAARGALANRLLESLHESEADPDAESAWDSEIARRLQELDSGAVEAVPWPEARQEILRAK